MDPRTLLCVLGAVRSVAPVLRAGTAVPRPSDVRWLKRILILIHTGNREASQWKCNDNLDSCSYKVRQGITILLSRNIIAGVDGSGGAGGG